MQDFLPLTIGTRVTYHDDESDEHLPPAKKPCYRDEEEDEEEEQAIKVFDTANYF